MSEVTKNQLEVLQDILEGRVAQVTAAQIDAEVARQAADRCVAQCDAALQGLRDLGGEIKVLIQQVD